MEKYTFHKPIWAIIPARSGSKGIPNKNIKHFAGKPLIVWSIEQAKKSKYISRIFVNTDGQDIANIAIENGAEVPFLRPIELSDDTATDFLFMAHFLDYLKEEAIAYPDFLVQLRPTSPLRKTELIDQCIQKFIQEEAHYDSLRTVVPTDKTPFKMYTISDDGNLDPLFYQIQNIKEPYNQCRQVLPKTYLHNGYVDIVKPSTIRVKQSISGDKILPFVMDRNETVDIDTPKDWEYAESIFTKYENNIKDQEIYVDIDETLCYYDDITERDYQQAKPILANIEKVNRLYQNNQIIIWTARGTKTGKDWRSLTISQLDAWGVLYHKLEFGKPAFDILIDDRCVNSISWDEGDMILVGDIKNKYARIENLLG